MQLVKPLLDIQLDWSALPTETNLLAEIMVSREGWHLFLYPYAGRSVHLGLASLLAWRVSKHQPNTFSIAVNDYGFELLSATEIDWSANLNAELFSIKHLLEDVLGSLNAGELAKRRFREIARISGLIFSGYPGAPKSTRQLQASSSLFYDVFRIYDPGNLLLTQAQQEVLRQELEVERLEHTLLRLQTRQIQIQHIKRPTPFGFPLLVERFRENLTSEKLADRITRMVRDLEKAAGGEIDEDELREQARFSVAEPTRSRSEKPASRRARPQRRTRINMPRPRHGF